MKSKIINYSLPTLSFLALLSFSCVLIIYRMLVTLSIMYGFLLWNLVLSCIPVMVSGFLLGRQARPKSLLFILSLLWLLFLPNAPYIITDFLHFRHVTTMPGWFDILLLYTFSFSGVAFGLLSMDQMHKIWETELGKTWSCIMIVLSCFLAGFGMYLGRFERYNSWNVVNDPFQLLQDIILIIPQLKAIGFSLGYGLLLLLIHLFFKSNFKH